MGGWKVPAPGPMRRGGCDANGAGTGDGTGVPMRSGGATGAAAGVTFGALPGADAGAKLSEIADDGACATNKKK